MEAKSEAHGINWIGLRELVRGPGGMVVVPPSVLADGRVYFFLDAGIPPIRELKPNEKPKPAIKADDPMEGFLDLFGSTEQGGELS